MKDHLALEATYQKAKINNNKLVFETYQGLSQALNEGAFYVKMPDYFNHHIANKFATNYYLDKDGIDDKYKGFRNLKLEESILGYSSPNDQVELLQLEVNLWSKYFPEDVTKMLNQINEISKVVLKAVFAEIGVNEQDIDKVTGGMDDDNGLQYCIFNHYRSSRNTIGFTAHKDSGFITTLYSVEPGLEGYKDGEWVPIDPVPGYFTINLGHALEILSAKMKYPVNAVYHRVRKTENVIQNMPDRFSIGSYIGPRFDMDLFQYQENGELKFFQTFMDFQIAKAKEMNYEFHPKVK